MASNESPALRWFVAQTAFYGFLAAYTTWPPLAIILAGTVTIAATTCAAALADPELGWLWMPPLTMLIGTLFGSLLASMAPLASSTLIAVRPHRLPAAIYTGYLLLAIPIALHGAIGTFGKPLPLVLALSIAAFAIATLLCLLTLWYGAANATDSARLTARMTVAPIGIALSSAALYAAIETRAVAHAVFLAALVAWVALGAALQISYFTTASVATRERLLSDDPRAKPHQTQPRTIALRWATMWIGIALIIIAAVAVPASKSTGTLVLVIAIALPILGGIALLAGSLYVPDMSTSGGSASGARTSDDPLVRAESGAATTKGKFGAASSQLTRNPTRGPVSPGTVSLGQLSATRK
jgi:hypothetical protein